jgi:hypothetical protein
VDEKRKIKGKCAKASKSRYKITKIGYKEDRSRNRKRTKK